MRIAVMKRKIERRMSYTSFCFYLTVLLSLPLVAADTYDERISWNKVARAQNKNTVPSTQRGSIPLLLQTIAESKLTKKTNF
ncbi:hypothetical protein BKA69DRAFT_1043304 [Paraphysoderma sedebokerense]|nr:hypothetical protein BKA69DRAFT_1043304 [Paraphysoderma sedebokerense]